MTLVLRVGGELVGSFLICLGIYLFSTIGLTLYGPYLSLWRSRPASSTPV